ncbi:helix-turn-helix domain-containing protein [Nocardioides aurantiacus]|uniref:Helix-turn-helix protein n=1 Tax=Nocardioides aurantiacus TaxID=86796 RepID=A0A3N2CYG0_9ACTN|nr:helix-turn-helix transcriptional regulator [Nocardioides aurantiacus]ROR92585.1 helix-turn-helix protein [Nocardioides aurantiacus]
MAYSTKALGEVIRELRESSPEDLSQQGLGERAGYSVGAGAGVSMSRVESGQMRPRPDRVERIAEALKVTPAELIGLAERRTVEHSMTVSELPISKATTRSKLSTAGRPTKERLTALHRVVGARTDRVDEAADSFNLAHDHARDKFFVPFIEQAHLISGAPDLPTPETLDSEEPVEPGAVTGYELDLAASRLAGALGGATVGAGVGGAAAYGAFTAAATFGTASTGAAISGLSGVAATNATWAFLGGGSLAAGGAGVAGGMTIAASVVAVPAAMLAIGGFLLVSRRNKQKELELNLKIDEAEAELERMLAGYEAMVTAIEDATRILEYIALHAGHAQERWRRSLSTTEAARWADLTRREQSEYSDFLRIAACQIAVANVNFGAFLAVDGSELEALKKGATESLAFAQDLVEELV